MFHSMAAPCRKTALGLLACFFSSSAALCAAEDEKGVVRGGVVFNIASDRKVESIGGIVQPEPLDLYLKRRLDAVSEQMARLDEKMDRLREDLRLSKGSGTVAAAPQK